MKRAISYIFWALPVIYLPVLAVCALTSDNNGGIIIWSDELQFLVILLYTFPLVFAFVEIGLFIGRVFDKKERAKGEMILNYISFATAALILLSALFFFEKLMPMLLFAAILVVLWIVGIIIFRKERRAPRLFLEKDFWICAMALFVAVSVLICFANVGEKIKSKVDDTVPTYDLEEEIARLEVKISSEKRINNFRLEQITVDTVDDKKHSESILWVIGHHDGSEKEMGICYKISYDDFLKLYRANDSFVVYNVIDDGKTPIVTDPPAWTIAGVYKIMFE
jgi:hypothetical protein